MQAVEADDVELEIEDGSDAEFDSRAITEEQALGAEKIRIVGASGGLGSRHASLHNYTPEVYRKHPSIKGREEARWDGAWDEVVAKLAKMKTLVGEKWTEYLDKYEE